DARGARPLPPAAEGVFGRLVLEALPLVLLLIREEERHPVLLQRLQLPRLRTFVLIRRIEARIVDGFIKAVKRITRPYLPVVLRHGVASPLPNTQRTGNEGASILL